MAIAGIKGSKANGQKEGMSDLKEGEPKRAVDDDNIAPETVLEGDLDEENDEDDEDYERSQMSSSPSIPDEV